MNNLPQEEAVSATIVKTPSPRPVTAFCYEFQGVVYESPSLGDLGYINTDLLEQELSKLPSELGYWGAVLALKKAQLEAARTRMKRLEAEQYLEQRREAEVRGAKTTEATLTAGVECAVPVVQAKLEVNNIWQQANQLQNVCDVLEAKQKSLVTIAGLRRAEAGIYNTMTSSPG